MTILLKGSLMWCFNRVQHGKNICIENIAWAGPFSWPGYQHLVELNTIPDIAGVYLLTFPFHDGFILYAAGITKSMKRRLKEHTREYKKGNYTILDMDYALRGERKEIWHGWEYAKAHRDEFEQNKGSILPAIEHQLCSFRIFVAEIPDTRRRERIEFSFMSHLYLSKEVWAELADRGMFLKGRFNSEMPIVINNICSFKIYGMPTNIEI